TTPNATQMSQLAATFTSGTDTAADTAVSDLMAGRYNAGSGDVIIQGQVNSARSVNLFAASAAVEAGASIEAGAQIFQATVNTDALVDATAAVRGDGSITIVGQSDVEIAGELRALMANGGGGSVLVNAPDSRIASTGVIDT